MSNKKFETETFHNFQIVRKSKDMNDDRHGVDWWTEHQAIRSLENIKSDERRASDWKFLTTNSNIRSMVVNINGSGDDGGIEDIILLNKYDDEIKPKNIHFEFPLIIEDETYLKSEANSRKSGYYSIGKGFVEYGHDAQGISDNRSDFLSFLSDGWKLLEANKHNHKDYITNVVLYKEKEKVSIPSNEYTNGSNYWSESSNYNLEFPKLTRWSHFRQRTSNALDDFVNSLYYGVLPGGWEINEGSSNSISVESDDLGNPLLEVEHNYYTEAHENYKINCSEVLNFVEKNVKEKENKVFNLDTKKGSSEFYTFVDLINSKRGG